MGAFDVFQGLRYHLNDYTCLSQYRVVPETKYIEPKAREVFIPTGILCSLLSVLAAVYLDNEMSLQAFELNDVWANWSLAAKLEAAYLAHTEVRPELALCVCKATSERSRLPGGHTPILAFPRLRGKGSFALVLIRYRESGHTAYK